jgi:5-enolpyruvylshikimate-3-phosphate synthase
MPWQVADCLSHDPLSRVSGVSFAVATHVTTLRQAEEPDAPEATDPVCCGNAGGKLRIASGCVALANAGDNKLEPIR